MATSTQRFASLLLGEPVVEWVQRRRPKSWRAISRDLCEATNGQLDLAPQTLMNWCGERAQVR